MYACVHMYVCVYVYMYVCMYICMHRCKHVHMYDTCTHVCTHGHVGGMYVCILWLCDNGKVIAILITYCVKIILMILSQ